MHFLGFHSFAEFNAYLTFVLLGMSIMMVVSAISSAPSFITEYFKFATGEPDAVAETPLFWRNANTFYNAGTYVFQVITEPLALVPCVRRIPLRMRLFVGLMIPFLEMILIIIIPAIKIPTQNGAIAVLMVVSILGGFSKALCNSCTNALVGPFPTKFMNGSQWGLTVSALFMSIVQIILKVSMGTSFHEVLTQSRIYFGIGIFIQVVAVAEMLILHRNPFAQRYVADFRVTAAAKAEGALGSRECSAADPQGEGNDLEPALELPAVSETEPAPGQIQLNEPTTDGGKLDDELAADVYQKDTDNSEEVRAVGKMTRGSGTVLQASGDADELEDEDQTGNLTSSQQMLGVSLLAVVRKVWPMLLCGFLCFFTSLLIFPGVFFSVTYTDEWYFTVIATLFNAGDFISRIILMFRALRPSPKVVVIGSLGRLLIIPLLVLCSRHIIRGVALPYVLVTLLGLSNGYFGTMACIHCPRTPTLRKAGERSLAAILSGVFLMLGLCFGSNLALAINLTM